MTWPAASVDAQPVITSVSRPSGWTGVSTRDCFTFQLQPCPANSFHQVLLTDPGSVSAASDVFPCARSALSSVVDGNRVVTTCSADIAFDQCLPRPGCPRHLCGGAAYDGLLICTQRPTAYSMSIRGMCAFDPYGWGSLQNPSTFVRVVLANVDGAGLGDNVMHASLDEVRQGFLPAGCHSYFASVHGNSSDDYGPRVTGHVELTSVLELEACLIVIQQPSPELEVCSNLGVLSVAVQGAATAGWIRFRWQWRPTSTAVWTDVEAGGNSREGASFTTESGLSSSLILDFSPGYGAIPAGRRLEFRCVASNDCTSELSGVSRVRGCECTAPGARTAKWKRATFDETGRFTGLVDWTPSPDDCKLPTAIVAHGLFSDPEAGWVPCLAEAARVNHAGANVLVADASEYMTPWDEIGRRAVETGEFTAELAERLRLPPQAFIPAVAAGAAGGGLAGAVTGAKNNIPAAADDLFRDLECFGCGDDLMVAGIYGHSFGGGIGASLGARLARAAGRPLPLLFTIDTPWRIGLLRMDEEGAQAAGAFANHVNYYSCDLLWGGAFGSPLQAPNTRNYNAGPSMAVEDACGVFRQHVCLPHTACGLLRGGAAGELLNGQTQPGNYQEGATPWSVVPGDPNDGCTTAPFPELEDGTPMTPDLTPGFSTGPGAQILNPSEGTMLQLAQVDPLRTAVSTRRVDLTGCPGYIVFEHQIANLSPHQRAVLRWNGRPIWMALGDTPNGAWAIGGADVSDGCPRSSDITLTLEPEAGGGGGAGAVRIRNIRILPRGVIACSAPPEISLHPTMVADCASGLLMAASASSQVLGVTYQWMRDGTPLTDGIGPGGAVVSGATGPILYVSDFFPMEDVLYSCILTNACGSVTTQPGVQAVCRADFNCDHAATSGDFFAFLTAFFIAADRADVNRDGAIDSRDFFDFLRAFFEGC